MLRLASSSSLFCKYNLHVLCLLIIEIIPGFYFPLKKINLQYDLLKLQPSDEHEETPIEQDQKLISVDKGPVSVFISHCD